MKEDRKQANDHRHPPRLKPSIAHMSNSCTIARGAVGDDGDVLVNPLFDQNGDQGSDEAESQTHEPQTVRPLIGTAGRKEVGRGRRNNELGAVRRGSLEDFEEKVHGCLVVIWLHAL